jgi:hypothetical protein
MSVANSFMDKWSCITYCKLLGNRLKLNGQRLTQALSRLIGSDSEAFVVLGKTRGNTNRGLLFS